MHPQEVDMHHELTGNGAAGLSDSSAVVRWERLLDLHQLMVGKNHIATVFQTGVWATHDCDGVGIENGQEIGVLEAMAQASLSAINNGLISI